MDEQNGRRQIAVVGGGIAGLAAAWQLYQASQQGEPLSVTLFEASERVGGKIRSQEIDGFTIEGGPDSFLTSKPQVIRLAEALHLQELLLPTQPTDGSYLFSRGHLTRLPAGLNLMVPSDINAFLESDLLSWEGKVRLLQDLVLPKRESDADETLESFVTRRLGREALERIAEPLIAGIHGAPPEKMSMRAAFPRFIEMEQRYGSLLKAALASRHTPPPPPTAGKTYFMSFRNGMETLPTAIAQSLPPGTIQRNTPVSEIVETPLQSHRYQLRLQDGRHMDADGVIVATPPDKTRSLLFHLDPEVAVLVGEIPQGATATVSFGFLKTQIPQPLTGSGFVIPAVEGRRLMGVTYLSEKFAYRAPSPEWVVVRGFVGGQKAQPLIASGKDALIQVVLDELRELVGVVGEPSFASAFLFPQAMPQYLLGHLDRVASIEAAVARHPALALAGSAYHGIGLPDCIESGERAATVLLTRL
ncbi:MAG: protoporphyrinogen oxidase [Firmicutes bacterium]|nr:protoporphyrinogen oxidase [Bacillota bacterium]